MRLRPATMGDMKACFCWRDDIDTRLNSRHPDPVDWENHVKWYSKALVDPYKKLLIYEDRLRRIGLIEWYHCDGLELGWTIAPECRGKRLATKMIRSALAADCGRVWAEIKKTNIVSINAAEKVGFKRTQRKPYSDEFAIWEHN